MRKVSLLVIAVLLGCGEGLPEQSHLADLEAAEGARFARETGSRLDWWKYSPLTIDAQIALKSEPDAPKYFNGFMFDLLEMENEIYIRASPYSDAPEATYLLRISRDQYARFKQSSSGESSGWSQIRCAMVVSQVKYYPLTVEDATDSEAGAVNLVGEGSLVVFGRCTEVEFYG